MPCVMDPSEGKGTLARPSSSRFRAVLCELALPKETAASAACNKMACVRCASSFDMADLCTRTEARDAAFPVEGDVVETSGSCVASCSTRDVLKLGIGTCTAGCSPRSAAKLGNGTSVFRAEAVAEAPVVGTRRHSIVEAPVVGVPSSASFWEKKAILCIGTSSTTPTGVPNSCMSMRRELRAARVEDEPAASGTMLPMDDVPEVGKPNTSTAVCTVPRTSERWAWPRRSQAASLSAPPSGSQAPAVVAATTSSAAFTFHGGTCDAWLLRPKWKPSPSVTRTSRGRGMAAWPATTCCGHCQPSMWRRSFLSLGTQELSPWDEVAIFWHT